MKVLGQRLRLLRESVRLSQANLPNVIPLFVSYICLQVIVLNHAAKPSAMDLEANIQLVTTLDIDSLYVLEESHILGLG